MDKTIYQYLKIGLVHSQAYPETFKSDESFIGSFKKVAQDPFFNAIEFHSPKNRRIRGECIKILKDSGMYRIYMGTVGFMNRGANMLSTDKSVREDAITLSCCLIDDALEWEAEEVMFSNAPNVREEKKSEAYKYLEEYYIRLADYIEQNGKIKLTMELIDNNPIAKNYLCGPIAEAKQVWEDVRKHTSNFGLVIDLSHLPLIRERPTETVRKAGDSFVHAHIGTCVMNPESELCGDMHPGFQVEHSRNSVDDIVEFIKAGMETKAISEKYPIPFSIEVHPYGNQTTDDVVEYAKDVLSQSWEKVKNSYA
jgi:sugar phosphate isomerase/epimerase